MFIFVRQKQINMEKEYMILFFDNSGVGTRYTTFIIHPGSILELYGYKYLVDSFDENEGIISANRINEKL